MNVGRNDPCPCGSGKKYKKCCLAKDEEEARLKGTQAAPQLLPEPEGMPRGKHEEQKFDLKIA